MLSLAEAALVFTGGAVGSGLRFGTLRLGTKLGLYASSTLGALNLTGCVLAGSALQLLTSSGIGGLDPRLSQTLVLGGLLGGFTTLSAVSLECATAQRGRERRRVLLEAAVTIILAAPMARLGMLLAGAPA